MGVKEVLFLVFAVLGGLALFIYGMNVMTAGMREAAGGRLRSVLSQTTRSRLSSAGIGSVFGFLVHSSATTVMLVGFVNAGLMTLSQAIPAMLGANVGTTLSMQVISFKLDEYALFAIALGFVLQTIAPKRRIKELGRILLGFGMLFLGMKLMKDSVQPYRELLQPALALIHGDDLGGMLLGVLVATAITGVIQSSGATIGMSFALISAGVITSLSQVYPIVLGAHIGTCVTALLGSLGTNIEARRCALSHLFFNIGNVALAIAAAPLMLWLVPLTSNDLIRQTANLHTLVMTFAALLVLPVSKPFARLVTLLAPSRKPPPEPSFLDETRLDRPEQAMVAVVCELQRVARTCAASFRLTARVILFEVDRKIVKVIKVNERVVNEIKLALKDYLAAMTTRYLSRRQSVMLQHLNRCMIDIERIGDHIDSICDLSLKRRRIPEALFDRDSLERLFDLWDSASQVLELVIESLDHESADFTSNAAAILQYRDTYVTKSIDAHAQATEKVAKRIMTPIAGIFYSEYVSALDRIVRHSKSIALAESQPQFWIRREKLDRIATQAPDYELPQLVDAKAFLENLRTEDYL